MTVAIKYPGKYIQGKDELAKLGLHTKKLGQKYFVLCSANTKKRIGAQIEESFAAAEKSSFFCEFTGKCTKTEIARVTEMCQESGCDVVVGAGGGSTIDTAKAVADNLGLPVVIIPTVASNDAPCSGISVIYNEEGVVVKALFTKRNPDLVLVDTQIIAQSPARLFTAGMGDAIATWFEAKAVQASGARTMAGALCSNTALMMARLCYDILLCEGLSALESVKNGQVSPEVEHVVEASILLSGLGFESGGLAAAHAINDGFVHVPGARELYHGERVAFGTFVQLVLEDAEQNELDRIMSFLSDVGLPMTLQQMGMSQIDETMLKKVAKAACVSTQSTKNLPFPVSEDDVYEAIIKADRLGRKFKGQ